MIVGFLHITAVRKRDKVTRVVTGPGTDPGIGPTAWPRHPVGLGTASIRLTTTKHLGTHIIMKIYRVLSTGDRDFGMTQTTYNGRPCNKGLGTLRS